MGFRSNLWKPGWFLMWFGWYNQRPWRIDVVWICWSVLICKDRKTAHVWLRLVMALTTKTKTKPVNLTMFQEILAAWGLRLSGYNHNKWLGNLCHFQLWWMGLIDQGSSTCITIQHEIHCSVELFQAWKCVEDSSGEWIVLWGGDTLKSGCRMTTPVHLIGPRQGWHAHSRKPIGWVTRFGKPKADIAWLSSWKPQNSQEHHGSRSTSWGCPRSSG